MTSVLERRFFLLMIFLAAVGWVTFQAGPLPDSMPASRLPEGSDPADAAEGVVSRALLGTYRRSMEIEEEIFRAARRYGVDPLLARAVCLYESGANENLTSPAGARGYFQVMPSTFHRMGVSTNIEAGIKYLGQLLERFEREDLALAAYNGGPAYGQRGRAMPLETLQYVLGVGYFKNALRHHEARIRAQASDLQLRTTVEGDTWWNVSQRMGLPLIVLRMYNPLLSVRPLSPGHRIVYPPALPEAALEFLDDSLRYVTRLGDQYLILAAIFGVPPDQIREANGLWHVDLVLPGTTLIIPLDREATWVEHRWVPGDDLGRLAEEYDVPVWDLVRDNRLWDQRLDEVETIRIDLERRLPRFATYRVRRGDTLLAIARRYGIALEALRRANGFARGHWRIRVGEVLRIPLS